MTVLDIDPEYTLLIPTMEQLRKIRTGKELPREFYYNDIHRVETCFLLMAGDDIAYIHWVYKKGDYSRFIKFKDGTAEINYATTLPKHRGRKLSAKMFSFTSKFLKNLGFKKVIVVCNENNPAVIKTFLMAGFKEVARITAYGLLNKRVHI